MVAKRKSSELKTLSSKERKKLTKVVVRGANALQRRVVKEFDKMNRSGECNCSNS